MFATHNNGKTSYHFTAGECVPAEIEAACLRGECRIVHESNRPNLRLVGEAIRSFLDATSYANDSAESA